jgi:prepilin-type N-terminal cleavage/methylation domain-containing protein
MSAALRDQRGFSLAELLVVSAVVGVLMAGVVTLYQQGVQAYVAGSNRVETQQNARTSMALMERELRSARSITAVASASDLTFVNQEGQTIRYHLSGTTLNRVQSGVTRVLLGGVEAVTITCYSAFDVGTGTYTTTTTPAQVRVLRLDIRTRTEETAGGTYTASQHAGMQATVVLRAML